VARGGLRWSDRREDFRTEVLGLVKAQMVKNAVIVPVGSKGGFYPKQLPPAATARPSGRGHPRLPTFLQACSTSPTT
jgi:glutamate dehydrogenase